MKSKVIILLGLMISLPLYAAMQHELPWQAPVKIYSTDSNELILSSDALVDFAGHVAITAFTYDYKTYSAYLKQLESSFTSQGWRDYLAAFNNSRNLEVVKRDQMMVSANLSKQPYSLRQHFSKGRSSWVITLPVDVVYRGRNQTVYQSLNVALTLVPVDQSIRVSRLVASPVDHAVINHSPSTVMLRKYKNRADLAKNLHDELL